MYKKQKATRLQPIVAIVYKFNGRMVVYAVRCRACVYVRDATGALQIDTSHELGVGVDDTSYGQHSIKIWATGMLELIAFGL